jgi:DNA-binding LytR/AlgR family response regulator
MDCVNKPRYIIAATKGSSQLRCDECLFVKDAGIIRRLKLEDILYVEAMGDYINFQTPARVYTAHGTLRSAEKRLSPSNFIRVHRSYIISLNKIDTLQDGGVVISGKFLPVADAYRRLLNMRLNVF